VDYKSLSRHFRVAAFVDLLGWSALTEGIELLILRRMKREASLKPHEIAAAERLKRQIETATRLDATVQEIVAELRDLATPLTDVEGVPDAKHFFENRHVIFVRSSDNIFVHSASFRWVAFFVSELLKRGLARGLLFRAGISGGVVMHSQVARSPRLDPLSQDISIFGDAITTAVAAEKAAKGFGVRAFIHDRLFDLLLDHDMEAIGSSDIAKSPAQNQLRWWADFTELWRDTEWSDQCTKPTENWFDEMVSCLRMHPDFEWNRSSPNGRERIEDTIDLLEANRPHGSGGK